MPCARIIFSTCCAPRTALRPHDLLQLGQGLLLERDTFSMQLPTQPLDVVPAVLCVAVQRPRKSSSRVLTDLGLY